MPIIPAFGHWKQEVGEFKAILGYIENSRAAWMRFCLKKQIKTKTNPRKTSKELKTNFKNLMLGQFKL
jgi:hypothetical protein